MSVKIHAIYLSVIAFLVTVLCFMLMNPIERGEEVVRERVDTLITTRIDTLTVTKVVEREKETIDTVYVMTEKEVLVPIPISRYEFYEEGLYNVIAAGYDVSIEEITVFPKTVYVNVDRVIEKTVMTNKWDLYLGGNVSHYRGELIPSISLSVKAPKKWLFSANMGYYDKSWLLGGTVQYKITN